MDIPHGLQIALLVIYTWVQIASAFFRGSGGLHWGKLAEGAECNKFTTGLMDLEVTWC